MHARIPSPFKSTNWNWKCTLTPFALFFKRSSQQLMQIEFRAQLLKNSENPFRDRAFHTLNTCDTVFRVRCWFSLRFLANSLNVRCFWIISTIACFPYSSWWWINHFDNFHIPFFFICRINLNKCWFALQLQPTKHFPPTRISRLINPPRVI